MVCRERVVQSTWMPDLAAVSFVVSILSGPIVLGALNAILTNKAGLLYEEKIKASKEAFLKEAQAAARAEFDALMERERHQLSKEFATREDVAELKGDVRSLLKSFDKLDSKLDQFLGMRPGT